MPERSVEDRLREEYFELLPDIRRVAEQLEAEVRYIVLPISLKLQKHERLIVTSRLKECGSAVEALRRRQEGATFDREREPESFTLTSLNDLAGVRVLGFPRTRLAEVDRELRRRFSNWVSDPVPGLDENDEPLAVKYHGYCEVSDQVRGELQIVSILTGCFWDVEHSAIYKPTPGLEGVADSLEMRRYTQEVFQALRTFEEEFERLVRVDPLRQDAHEE